MGRVALHRIAAVVSIEVITVVVIRVIMSAAVVV
ncbi:hypothetical protein A2U01_0024726 [Trifolium medium]|uniref:Uncharacterized protein n=1 Tax=Trifolium medium TaxID=97028 RepID=A0A392NX54_9FABA|nr:hypothetical protein [Trifolium medium]